MPATKSGTAEQGQQEQAGAGKPSRVKKPKSGTPLVLTKASLAEALDCSTAKVDRMRHTGELGPQPFMLGGTLRWDRAEVEAWLQLRKAGKLIDAAAWKTYWPDAMKTRSKGQ